MSVQHGAIVRRRTEVIDKPLGQAAQGFVQATGGRYVKAIDDKATRDTIVKWSDRVGLACDIATVPGKKYAATKALGAVLHPVQTARRIGSGLSTAHAACSSAYRWVGRRLAGNGDDLARAAAGGTDNAVEAAARSANDVAEVAAKSADDLAETAANPRTRLPRTKGRWEGVPGDGDWFSEIPEVNQITRGRPIRFKGGRPDFSPWSKGTIKFEKGQLQGTADDFDLVYQYVQREKGLPSKTAAQNRVRDRLGGVRFDR